MAVKVLRCDCKHEFQDKYYGKDALLIKQGGYIYNVTNSPDIYHHEAH